MAKPQQQLSKTLASALVQASCIEDLSAEQLLALFQTEPGLRQYAPQDFGQIDPRSNDRILFNPSRAKRPNADTVTRTINTCPICDGTTTSIIDFVELRRRL